MSIWSSIVRQVKRDTRNITKASLIVALGGPAAYYLYKRAKEQQNRQMTTRSTTPNTQTQAQRNRDRSLRPPSEFGTNVESTYESQQNWDEGTDSGGYAADETPPQPGVTPPPCRYRTPDILSMQAEIASINQKNMEFLAMIRANAQCAQTPVGKALLAQPQPANPRCLYYPSASSVLNKQREAYAQKQNAVRGEPLCQNLGNSQAQVQPPLRPPADNRVPAVSTGGAVE